MLQTWYDLLQTRCSTQKHTWFLPGKRSNFHTTFERKIVSLLVTLTGCGLVDGDETKIKKKHVSQTGSLQESGSYVKG